MNTIDGCEAKSCAHNMEGKCGAGGIWVDSEGYCDSYEKEGEGWTDEEIVAILKKHKEPANDPPTNP